MIHGPPALWSRGELRGVAGPLLGAPAPGLRISAELHVRGRGTEQAAPPSRPPGCPCPLPPHVQREEATMAAAALSLSPLFRHRPCSCATRVSETRVTAAGAQRGCAVPQTLTQPLGRETVRTLCQPVADTRVRVQGCELCTRVGCTHACVCRHTACVHTHHVCIPHSHILRM